MSPRPHSFCVHFSRLERLLFTQPASIQTARSGIAVDPEASSEAGRSPRRTSRNLKAIRKQSRKSVVLCRHRDSAGSHLLDADAQRILGVLNGRNWIPGTEQALRSLNIRLSVKAVREVIERQTDTNVAMRFFQWASEQENYIHSTEAYAAIIRHLGKSGKFQLMYDILKEMINKGSAMTCLVVKEIIMSFGRSGMIEEACEVFKQMKTLGCRPNVLLYNCFISVLMAAGLLGKASSVYKEMSTIQGCKPDTVTFNIMIDNFGKIGNVATALHYLKEMIHRGIEPNVKTYTSLIRCLCRAGMIDEARRLFEDIRSNSYLVNVVTYTELMKGFGEAGKIDEALNVFKEMLAVGFHPDQVSYNILIDCLGKSGQMQNAVQLLDEMEVKRYGVSVVTYNSTINGFVKAGKMDEAQAIFRRMLQNCIAPDAYTYAILIDGFCKAGATEVACKIFQGAKCMCCSDSKTAWHVSTSNQSSELADGFLYSIDCTREEGNHCGGYNNKLVELTDKEVHKRTVVMHNVLLDGLVKAGKLQVACDYFRVMQEKGCHLDIASYTILIHGLGNAGKMREAFDLFLNLKKLGFKPDMVLYNTLINTFKKSGRSEEIQELITEMISQGFKPDIITYTSVLDAVNRKADVPLNCWV